MLAAQVEFETRGIIVRVLGGRKETVYKALEIPGTPPRLTENNKVSLIPSPIATESCVERYIFLFVDVSIVSLSLLSNMVKKPSSLLRESNFQ